MIPIRIRRHDFTLIPESARVIIRPFIPSNRQTVTNIIASTFSLTDEDIASHLATVMLEFDTRHVDLEKILLAHCEKVRDHVSEERPMSRERQVLIGALFSGEYALESAAIFNPSIVPHPDQTGVSPGSLRFIMSLRATGEGHISSIEFRAGTVTAEGSISIEPVSRFVTEPEAIIDPLYEKVRLRGKLDEMGVDPSQARAVMAPLGDWFSRSELNESVGAIRNETHPSTYELNHTLECIQWLADSNYSLRFSNKLAVSERIIFPVASNESNGIEDARFVRFVDDDGAVTYYATYTAYNGHDILSQLIETDDFLNFHMLTLNGSGVQNKGMALFPRRIHGRYAMLSRQDDQNLFVMFSDSPYHWVDPFLILRPAEMWELVKIGNCGSPIETEEGWLVITHGVGPMRKYCIGAALLDLDDPRKVIGRLEKPLICPEGHEREGYVPNVVYSCGSLLHGRELILPFAVSDQASVIASVCLDDLLQALLADSNLSKGASGDKAKPDL